MSDTAKLTVDGKEYELPVIKGSEGEKAIDISNLRAETGYITMDPGYVNTGATASSITFLDGEKVSSDTGGFPSNNWRKNPLSSKPATC